MMTMFFMPFIGFDHGNLFPTSTMPDGFNNRDFVARYFSDNSNIPITVGGSAEVHTYDNGASGNLMHHFHVSGCCRNLDWATMFACQGQVQAKRAQEGGEEKAEGAGIANGSGRFCEVMHTGSPERVMQYPLIKYRAN